MSERGRALRKSLTILLATLLVGVLAGATITGAVVRQRLEKVRSFTSSEGFVVQFTDVLEPLTEEQRAAIEPLISDAGDDIEDLIELSRLELFLIVEGLQNDLEPHLTSEQLQRLKDRREEVRERFMRNQRDEAGQE